MIYNVCHICNEKFCDISEQIHNIFIAYDCPNNCYKIRFSQNEFEYSIVHLKFDGEIYTIFNYKNYSIIFYDNDNKEIRVNFYIDSLDKLKLYLLFM